MNGGQLVTGVDFLPLYTRDLAESVRFYGDTLGLACAVHIPDRGYAEFETGNLTLGLLEAERMGIEYTVNRNAVALHVDDVAQAREELEGRGVGFAPDTIDSGVCHMAFFSDPDGNALMLHHRYAPRVTKA
jgi:predicted enzyme related to lactoylglutathione lyase